MMCELTLEDFGYRPDEAAIVRRIHVLLHEQDAATPPAAWLTRKHTWQPFVDVPPQPEMSPCITPK